MPFDLSFIGDVATFIGDQFDFADELFVTNQENIEYGLAADSLNVQSQLSSDQLAISNNAFTLSEQSQETYIIIGGILVVLIIIVFIGYYLVKK